MTGVVDVFAGTGEMYKFTGRQQLGLALKFGLDPVFHRFHIMVGGLLDRLDGLAIGFGKIQHQAIEVASGLRRERRKLLEARIAQGHQPSDLHLQSALHVAQFAHDGAQFGQSAGVAPIQGREG